MFYNIVHGIAPHYLQELLLPFYRPTHSYNLKNDDNLNIVIPQTRTVSYYNSFFTISYSVMEWTTIGNKMYWIFSHFKTVLKKPIVETTKNVKIFNYSSRRENIIHFQLRNESSDLKAHLFNQYLCQSASYNNCGYPYEDNYDFFFACLAFNIHRLTLYDNDLGITNLSTNSLNELLHI